MSDPVPAVSFTRTLRLKVRAEAYRWLSAAAVEVNQVWNWANATGIDAADRHRRANARFLTGFDLCNLSAGASEYFERIGADMIQRVCCEYARKRKAAKRVKLRWRVSRGARRSLGWVPFKAGSLKRKGAGVRFCGKSLRGFERERLEGVKWRDGVNAARLILLRGEVSPSVRGNESSPRARQPSQTSPQCEAATGRA